MSESGLTNRQKSLLKALLTRGGRKRSGMCRCEGVRAVRELLTRQPELVEFAAATERGLAALELPPPENLHLISENEMSALSDTLNSQGIIAVARIPQPDTTSVRGDFILALDLLNDPGNFGTIARTFRAIGGRELWYTAGSVDPWCDKAVRAGMGAQFSLNCRKFTDLPELCRIAGECGYPEVFVSTPHGGESCFTAVGLYNHSVVVIGNEANGVSVYPENSRRVMIPMPGDYESLNAAQAATVLLLEQVRRKTLENIS